MKTQSAKNKGRKLQKHVRDSILERFPELEKDDVRSTSMGNQGEDVQLSPQARMFLPVAIECKNLARIACFSYYQQAEEHAEGKYEPVVVMKQNRHKPLALIDFDFFLHLMRIKSHG